MNAKDKNMINNTTDQQTRQITKILLTCGVAGGPFFYILAVLQIMTRAGFDIRHNAISQLSLSNLGWIQDINFFVTGIFALACAFGMRRFLKGKKAGTWGPLLILIYAIGLLLGAFFHPDPGFGYPSGAPAGMPTTMTSHAAIHEAGFDIAFIALIIDSFVFVGRFLERKEKRWAWYSGASGVLALFFIIIGSTHPSMVGILIAIAGVFGFGWVSVVAAKLKSEIKE